MKVAPDTPRTRTKSAVALALTFTAGMVDIVSYIAVYHLFVAHMTGTTVRLGSVIVTGDRSEAVRAGIVLASFIAGSVVGRSVIEAGSRRKIRSVATITLLAEAMLIAIAIWIGPLVGLGQTEKLSTICGLLALLAAAMGLQTATLTRIGPLTIHTTFVTGMLNKFAQAVAAWLFWLHDEWRGNRPWSQILLSSGRHTAFRNARFMFAIWFTYTVGAVVGTSMSGRWRIQTLYVPVMVLVLAAVVDQFRPLSIEEEKEQA